MVAPSSGHARERATIRLALTFAMLGFLGLALSTLTNVVGHFGENPRVLGALATYNSLPAELFGWAFFVIAFLLVLSVVTVRGTSQVVSVGVLTLVVGALLQ